MSKAFWIVFLSTLSFITQAQHLPGIAMGNYSGTNALFHNPAFVSDSRFSVYGNLVGVQLYAANNHVQYNAPFSSIELLTKQVSDEYRDHQGKIRFKRSYLDEKINGNQKFLNAGGDIRLPSIMFGLFEGRMGIGITSRLRILGNFSNVSEPIARTITKKAGFQDIQNQVYTNQSANAHFNGFGEIGFTLGGTLIDQETDFVKIGLSVKRLVGLYNTYIQVDNATYQVQPTSDLINHASGKIQIDEIHVKYGTTRNDGLKNFQMSPAWLFGNVSPGNGWGIDLGAVYEYRPNIHKYQYTEKGVRRYDATQNKYLYKIAVSLIDVGRINFKNPYYLLQNEVHTTNKQLSTVDFNNSKTLEEIYYDVNEALGDKLNEAPLAKSVLPTSFQASIDYAVQKNIYLNALWVQNLIRPSAFGMKAESNFTITPRYEHRFYELSLPISVMNRYRSPAVGLAGRFGPFWLGTDHLIGLLNIGKPRAMNVYFGISTGLFRKPPKDPNPCWPAKQSLFKRIFTKQ
jgi:hypothetical protein